MAKKENGPIVESLAVAVPPVRAWEALTSPHDLSRIIFGRVELEPKPGADFCWHWGLWQKVAPKKRDYSWRGIVLDVVPGAPAQAGATLILGDPREPGVTCFTVKGGADASLVTVVHQGDPRRADREEYRHGWADFLLRFKTYLEFRPGGDDILLRALVRGTPGDVLRTWLNARAMAKILPGKVKLAAKVGGKFLWEWRGRRDSGTFLEIEPGRHLAFTWEGSRPASPAFGGVNRPSEVRLAAGRVPYGTLVSLHHTGFVTPDRASWERFHEWHELLERLRCYLYFGKKIRVVP
jgi:uncharacterized protein YndB with AHSA1/START domain